MVRYQQSERVATTIPRSIYEKIVRDAEINTRSLSAQIAHLLKLHYREEEIASRIHHNEGGKQ